jgi:hypothetical protein
MVKKHVFLVDNVRFHKVQKIVNLIINNDHEIIYTPPL